MTRRMKVDRRMAAALRGDDQVDGYEHELAWQRADGFECTCGAKRSSEAAFLMHLEEATA